MTRRSYLITAPSIALMGGGMAFLVSALQQAASGLPEMTDGGVEFRAVLSGGKRFMVCFVDLRKTSLQLFHSDGSDKAFNRFGRLEDWLRANDRRLVFAMNAGMFHPGFAPVGLLVSDGQTKAPLNTADGKGNFFLKPNGVFAITAKGAAIVETSEFPKLPGPVRVATQSGPLLVRGGKVHPAFNAESVSRLIRNGVGVASAEQVVFAISEDPVNFHEFAVLFRDILHCPDALFLDGTISSLCAPALKRCDSSHDLGPIIGVTAPL